MKSGKFLWVIIAISAIGVGLYPLTYYLVDMHGKGLFSSKTPELLADRMWHSAFYTHITFGGIALLTGWSQFIEKFRNKFISTHRLLGKIYVAAVVISSMAGFYIALFASGGITCVLGFGLLAITWFVTVIKAYTSILKRQYKEHENWMIRNYAVCFAAVTLRIYLPLSTQLMQIDFVSAYRVISWLCWIPNLFIAQWIINKRKEIPVFVPQAVKG